MTKAFVVVGVAALCVAGNAHADAFTTLWDSLLRANVDAHGRVSYAKINRDAFAQAEALVAKSSPARNPTAYATKDDALAYYLNAYNLCVWKGVLARLPSLKSVIDDKSFFDQTKYSIGGDMLTLHAIENDIVRAKYKDPRVHMALNCASGGCPELPPEAFDGKRLNQQLDREAKKFVAQPRNVALSVDKSVLKLSHIFDWYKDDFGKTPVEVIASINKYRAADAQLPTTARIEYVDYDWRLNDTTLAR